MKITKNQMYEAVENGTAKVLTLEAAKSLKGKKIATIYFGYDHQDGIDEFIVGEIISETDYAATQPCEGYENQLQRWEQVLDKERLHEYRNKLKLLSANGEDLFMFCHLVEKWFDVPTFCKTDADRAVYYIEILLKHRLQAMFQKNL